MPDEILTDLSGWSKENSDQEKIKGRAFVPCRICEAVFQRIRLTRMYCDECKMAFCQGEHGTHWRKRFVCVACAVKEKGKNWPDSYLALVA